MRQNAKILSQNRSKRLAWLGTVLLSINLLGAPLANAAPTEGANTNDPNAHAIAAVVNDDIVTTHDLKQRVLFMLATTGAERDEASLLRIQKQALRNLVDEHLQMQEAKKYDQTISDAEVNSSVAKLIGRNGLDPNEVVQTLAAAGVSIETLRDQVRAEIAWQRIINGLYGSRIRISDAQVNETLDRISANASKPSFRMAEIYIEATPDIGGMEGAITGANAMITQAQNGAPFPLLAQQFSSAASAAQGGDIGWVREGELRPELNQVLVQMEPGSISKPIEVPGGVYVIAMIDKKTPESEMLYSLKQVSVKNDDMTIAKARLLEIGKALSSCDSLDDDMDGMDDVEAADMGEMKSSDLNDTVAEALKDVEVGGLSAPFERPGGATSIMVCERQVTGSDIPTADQVENRMIDQKTAKASQRLLRDLRRQATLVVR